MLLSVFIIITLVIVAIYLVRRESVSVGLITDAKGRAFAGTETCKNCHAAIYNTFEQTAHNHTSALATKQSILGSFIEDSNVVVYNSKEKVMMEEKNQRFSQVAYIMNKENEAHSFDITVGTGVLGQSYLYWQDNRLYQLPVSYISQANTWGNSPGFPANIVFDRTITPRCLECHTTYAKAAATDELGYAFDKNAILFGVNCERCHGPAAAHVQYHEDQPGEKKGKFIINAALLSRQQQLDACAICHSGKREAFQLPFSFTTGDNLSNFYAPAYSNASAANADVHGNKYELITSSQCFLKSNTMTCSSCHNTHVQEKGNLVLLSQRCMNCHIPGEAHFCSVTGISDEVVKANCIDCHMPAHKSMAIELTVSDNSKLISTPAMIRTHLIKVYPDAYKKFIDKLNKQ